MRACLIISLIVCLCDCVFGRMCFVFASLLAHMSDCVCLLACEPNRLFECPIDRVVD